MSTDFSFNSPPFRDEPVVIATMWVLKKGKHIAVCEPVNLRHAAVRCDAGSTDGELQPESRAENDPLVLFDQAETWNGGV